MIHIHKYLLYPPITFLIVMSAVLVFSELLSRLAFKPKTKGKGQGKSYGCGEDVPSNLMQPEYGDFFPFAFFFTLLHVVALMICTVPVKTASSFAIAFIYIMVAVTGLAVLFRR